MDFGFAAYIYLTLLLRKTWPRKSCPVNLYILVSNNSELSPCDQIIELYYAYDDRNILFVVCTLAIVPLKVVKLLLLQYAQL